MSEWYPLQDGFLMQYPCYTVAAAPFFFDPETHKFDHEQPSNFMILRTDRGPAVLIFTDIDLTKRFIIGNDKVGSVLIASFTTPKSLIRLMLNIERFGVQKPNILVDMSEKFVGRLIPYEEVVTGPFQAVTDTRMWFS
jgi:hypothetical protein